MQRTPRSQRAQLWVWLYIQLFGTPDDTEDDGSEGLREGEDLTDTQQLVDEFE